MTIHNFNQRAKKVVSDSLGLVGCPLLVRWASEVFLRMTFEDIQITVVL